MNQLSNDRLQKYKDLAKELPDGNISELVGHIEWLEGQLEGKSIPVYYQSADDDSVKLFVEVLRKTLLAP